MFSYVQSVEELETTKQQEYIRIALNVSFGTQRDGVAYTMPAMFHQAAVVSLLQAAKKAVSLQPHDHTHWNVLGIVAAHPRTYLSRYHSYQAGMQPAGVPIHILHA